MARSALGFLLGVCLCLGALSCATHSASLNAYSDPGFHSRSITSLAVFPVRNARLSPGEAQEVNRRISAGIVSKNPSIKLLSAAEATRLLNEKSLASDWARFLDNYSTSGVPDSQALQKFGAALSVQAILQAEMVNVVQEDGAYGRRPGRTRVTVRATMLSLTDGKLLWEATSDGLRETATTVEKAPPIAEAISLAIDKLLSSLPL
jgi:hypothetical protein